MRLTKRILKKKALDVEWSNPTENQRLAVKMIHFMKQEHGIGLAAPQIGIGKRLFVMHTDGKYRMCFNPKLLSVSKEIETYNEGCLSFKDIFYNIERPATIEVLYYDYIGNSFKEELTGISARCFLHELDHLDGIVFKQRLEKKVPKKYDYANIKSGS